MVRSVAAGLLIAALVAAAPAEARAKRKPPCRPAGAKTLDGSGGVRVYVRRGRVVACSPATRRTIRLGPYSSRPVADEPYVRTVVVAGRHVAWVVSETPGSVHDPYVEALHLADVRRGRLIDFGGQGCVSHFDDPSQIHRVGSFDLDADGRLAWICTEGAGWTEVHRFDSRGPALLDTQTFRPGPGRPRLDRARAGRPGVLVHPERGALRAVTARPLAAAAFAALLAAAPAEAWR